MKLADSWTNYKLIFHELESKSSKLIFEDDKVEVYTIPLDHRVYTNGFLFKEKEGERKLIMNEVLKHQIDVSFYRKLQQGFDVENEEGKIVKNETVTRQGVKPKSYAFCSDTAYNEAIVSIIKKADVLYHEATFLEKNKKLALPTKHSTAKQAAEIAQKAQVGKLILGHFSTRYKDLEVFKSEAQTIFQNVELAEDGKTFEF
jgi:ribonuclease Z